MPYLVDTGPLYYAKAYVFLLSSKAGGCGLNLIGASASCISHFPTQHLTLHPVLQRRVRAIVDARDETVSNGAT
eukprot:2516085-Amphidinium_carterae.2